MRIRRGLLPSGCLSLGTVWCSTAAAAFSYRPWIQGETRTLETLSIELDQQTGDVVVNGADSQAPTTAFAVGESVKNGRVELMEIPLSRSGPRQGVKGGLHLVLSPAGSDCHGNHPGCSPAAAIRREPS
ncbi:MAG: hypothetical protein JW751_13840 [Polyangiaceae bacterium]|nr:hypothetical protein [Polyangiaceae bacterium]